MSRRESNEVEYDGDDVLFYSEYDPDFILALKNKVPVNKRNWDPENFCWVVHRNYAGTLSDLIEEYMGITVDLDTPRRD